MKKITLLFIVLFSSISLVAQDTHLRWAKQFAGTSNLRYGRGVDIETDADGNVYTVGIFTGTVDFDPGPGVFNLTPISTDVYISKLDAAGNFLWAKQITGSFGTLTRSFTLDKDGNIYVTGTFQATVDFDLGPGTFNMTANGFADLFILKLTANGDFIWAKQIGESSATAEIFSVITDSFGNVYFDGGFRSGSLDFDPGPGTFILSSSTLTTYDAFICKLNPVGDFVWARSVGGSEQDIAAGLHLDKLGNIYVGGFFRTIVDFDPGPGVFNLTCNGLDDIFILKLDAAGNFIWARSVGGTSIDDITKIVTDDAGNIYATGFFKTTVDFDPGPAIFNLSTAGDAVFVLKLDASGNFVWAKKMGGFFLNNMGTDIVLDKLGNVYTTGSFLGPADFDPGPGTFILNSMFSDLFISKLDKNGIFVWAKSAGGASTQDWGNAITVDNNLNVYTTGQFGSTVDFDLETPTYYLTAITVTDPFVLKVAQCASAVFTTVNKSICEGQSYYAGGANQITTGIYRDTLLTLVGCDSIIITDLKVNPNPDPDLGPDRKICTNEQVLITPGVFSNYLWHDNSSQPNYTVNNAGKYWVTVTNVNNCSATDTLNILSLDTIPINFLPADQDLCYGNVIKITVPNYATYQWNTGSTGDHIDITNFGTYYLTVKDFNSCTGTDSITISRRNCIYIGIPNAFTPNGDTKNDIFKPTIFQAVQSFSFMVFNRYGQKVFETHEYGQGWDGTLKGKPQVAGSYVYNIKYTNIFGVETVENGSVLLIR